MQYLQENEFSLIMSIEWLTTFTINLLFFSLSSIGTNTVHIFGTTWHRFQYDHSHGLFIVPSQLDDMSRGIYVVQFEKSDCSYNNIIISYDNE